MFKELVDCTWRGARIGFGEATADEGHAFWPGEAPAMARATPARQAEFAARRAAARRALRAIGLVPFAIPMGADRAPVWPSGVIGSITHHDGRCLAVAARRRAMAGLGIDVEPMEPLSRDLWPEILTPGERAWLARQDDDLQPVLARMVFAAKEATYKAIYPRTRQVVGFDAMEILPDPARGRYVATLIRAYGPLSAGTRLEGQLAFRDGLICTLMGVPVEPALPVDADAETICFQALAS